MRGCPRHGQPRRDRKEGKRRSTLAALAAVIVVALAAVIALAPGAAAAQTRMNHIAINVADQARSIAYYHDAFGLSEIPAPLDAAPGHPRWLRIGNGIELH